MRISIIGVGNMAHYIGERMRFMDLEFVEVMGRDPDKTAAFVQKYGGEARKTIAEMEAMVDIIVVAVKDDAIAECAEQVQNISCKIIVHCSGTKSIDVLGDFSSKAVLWPIFSLNSNRNSPYPNKVPLAIEFQGGSSEKEMFLNFAHILSSVLYEMDVERRSLLHLAAVFSNNYIHHLMVITEEFCEKYNLPFDALKPIIYQTTNQVDKTPLRDLQTGPAIRNDQKTLDRHMDILKEDHDLLALYQQFVKSIQK